MDKEFKVSQDSLLSSLVIITKLNHQPFTAESLIVGLPDKHDSTPIQLFSLKGSKSLFSRAAKRAGFKSSLIQKPILELSNLLLPVILVLKENKSCVLEHIDFMKGEATIIFPDGEETPQIIDLVKLEEEYLGFLFLVKKMTQYQDGKKVLEHTNAGHWFWDTLKLSKNIYRDVIVASLVINIFVLIGPLFTMNVYDRVVPNNAIETLWVLTLGVLVIYGIDLFLKTTRTYFLELAGKKSDIIMSSLLFEKVMDLKMEKRFQSVGNFANNLKEFDSIRNFLTSTTIALVIDLPFTIIFLVAIYYLANATMVVIPVAFMTFILLYTFWVKDELQKSIKSTFKASSEKSGILIESLSNLETIKTLNASGHSQWRWEESTGDIAHKSVKTKLLSSSISNLTNFIVQLNTVLIVVVGVYMIKDMELTMGGLIATVILASRVITPIGQVASLLSTYEQTKASYTNLNNIMNMEVERPEGKKFVHRETFKGKIEFKDVSFSYPESSKGSLEHVSFCIEAGEKIGLIGKNGSGKTTIEKLILGLYRPSSGQILIDGIDINQIDPADLRKQVGYVSQDINLFKGTVKDNVLYKAPYVSDEELLYVSSISGVDTIVNEHPQGFDMPINEQGYGLSGGQKQSIAVARALVLNPSILLLDEPTNSMDNQTEGNFKLKLKTVLQEKTMILVTHKHHLLDLVDKLIVLEKGKILFQGEKNLVLHKLNTLARG